MLYDPKPKILSGLGKDYKLRICNENVLHKHVDLDKSVLLFVHRISDGTDCTCRMLKHSVVFTMNDMAIIIDFIIDEYPDSSCNEFVVSNCKFLLDSFSVILKLYNSNDQNKDRSYYKKAIKIKDIFDIDSKNTVGGYQFNYSLKESILKRYLEILEYVKNNKDNSTINPNSESDGITLIEQL